MKTSKIFIRYSWFLLLVVIAIYYLFFRSIPGTLKSSWKAFAVKDTASISSVILSNDSSSLMLSRSDKGWILNNSYSTRPEAIQALFNVIVRLDSRSPLPRSVSDSLNQLIQSKGINIKILDNTNIIKEYNLFTTKTLGLGTIGRIKDAEVSFSLELIGFHDDIYSLFVLEPDYWKSNKLFVATLDQISNVEVEIPENPEKSFAISLNKDGINLKAAYFDKKIEKFDTGKVISFLYNLTNLSYEKLLKKKSIEEKAAIVLSQPNQIFTISLTNGNKLVLKTYPIPIDEYRDEFGRTIKFDLNKLYISFNNDAIIAVASYMVFDPVLKDLSSFRLKN